MKKGMPAKEIAKFVSPLVTAAIDQELIEKLKNSKEGKLLLKNKKENKK